MNQDDTPLYQAMKWHVARKMTAFDVPGHKRTDKIEYLTEFIGKETIQYDVNSMPGLDNLNHPNGVIQEAKDLMAEAFGADYAFFMVGGTTQSVQAMILSSVGPGDKIILPRNVHKSVINALILCDAMPIYIQAEINEQMQFAMGVSFETVKQAIDENPDAKAILLINPTYYGIASPLEAITEYAHEQGLIVLVDEAHGAHFHFHRDLPKSAMACGADMSAASVHKTGGALTQASVLLLRNERISPDKVQQVINLMQTTSSSYLLMTSLDIARRNLAMNGERQLDEIIRLVRNARNEINKIPELYAYSNELINANSVHAFDETKLGIYVAGLGITGFEVYDILYRDYKIQMELADTHNVLAIVSLGDSEGSLNNLVLALKDISRHYAGKTNLKCIDVPNVNPIIHITPRQAFYAKKVQVPLAKSVGRIVAESVMVYPPGIPFLAPGEEITQEILDYILFLKTQHSQLTDMRDKTLNSLLVVEELT